jgi:carboxypeptidase PM20D1
MKNITKLMTIYFFSIILVLSAIILLRTRCVGGIETHITPAKKVELQGDFTKQIERLSKGIAINTSQEPYTAKVDTNQYKQFIEQLQQDYPRIHSKMDIKCINKLSYIYCWKGKDDKLEPILFLKNYDTPYHKRPAIIPDTSMINHMKRVYANIPAIQNEDYIHGYGTQYAKSSLYALLEVIESLITMGFQPQRDIYLTLGHDNEIGGQDGSKEIAQYLRRRYIHFDAIYDKGGYVAYKHSIKQLDPHNLSLIGISEKGRYRATIKPSAAKNSVPNKARMSICKIVKELEKEGMQMHLTKPVFNSMKMLMNNVDFISRMAIANKTLFEAYILEHMQKDKMLKHYVTNTPIANIQCRQSANGKTSPENNEISLDIRILPNSSSADVEAYLKKVCSKFNVEIEPLEKIEPSPTSSVNTKGYKQLVESVENVFPNTSIMPGLTLHVTNAHYFQDLSPNIYRFTPTKLNDEDIKCRKTVTERLSHTSFKQMCYFYYYLISQYDKQE